MEDFERLQAAVEAGDRETAVEITQGAIDEGLDPHEILQPMTKAMAVVGDRFSRQEIFVPEMLISARAMKGAVALLEPLLIGAGHKPDKTAVLGTVRGDLHDIGKNLVAMMLKGANFEVIDLGTNTTADEYLAAAREHGADLIGCSALLTTTMNYMRDVTAAVAEADDLPDLRVIIGGAPVTLEFAIEIRADGWAPDAATAVHVATAVVERARGERELDGVINPEALAASA